jgi:hypothetical protein
MLYISLKKSYVLKGTRFDDTLISWIGKDIIGLIMAFVVCGSNFINKFAFLSSEIMSIVFQFASACM